MAFPFAWLVEAVAPLFKKRDTWYILLIVLLALAFDHARHRADAAEAVVDSRPKIETHIETKTVTVVKQGPERIVEKIVKGEIIERVVYKDASETTTGTERALDKNVTPACLPASAIPWREVSAAVDPTSTSKLVGLDGSVTLGGRFVLGAGGRFDRGGEGHARLGVRF